jgi:RHS repeat-associated protein
MKTKAWLVLAGAVLMLLAPHKASAGGACTAARFHDWKNDCPPYAGAGGAGAAAGCPNCAGMPRWWVSEPYINLGMVDTPMSYTTSSGQSLDFTFYYKQRCVLPEPDETPIAPLSIQSTGPQYVRGANCGADAYWGHNWNMSVVIQAIGNPSNNNKPYVPAFSGGYYALVFNSDGTIDNYTNYPGALTQDPKSQTILTDVAGQGYPAVAEWNYPGGPQTNMPVADANGYYWNGTNVGVKLVYADGSQDVFGLSGCISYDNFPLLPKTNDVVRLLLTKRIDAAGRVTQLGYEYYHDPIYYWQYRVKYVVDPDLRTNTFFYTSTTNNQLSEIDDPYGRKITLNYSAPDSTLSRITDAAGLTTSFQYPASQVTETANYSSDGSDTVISYTVNTIPSSGWITQMSTPYGTNKFCYFEMDDNTVTDGVQQRAIYATEPEGAQQLYYYLHKAGSLVPATATAPSVPGITDFDNGSNGGVTGHNALYFRNTFHWGRRQFAALKNNYGVYNNLVSAMSYQTVNPTYSQSEFAAALSSLGASDLNEAEMKHWLWQSDGASISGSLSSQRAPSFDAAGQNPGLTRWYDYPNKPASGAEEIGASPQIGCIAVGLPDGTVNYSTYHFYPAGVAGAGLASDNEFTYSQPNGTTGVLTNWFAYSTNNVDLLSLSNSAGQYVNYGYNGSHQIIAVTNALNQVTTLSWNPNLTGIQFPSGQTISLGYYPSSTSPTTNTSSLLQWLTIQPEGRALTNNNYYAGLPASVTDDRGLTVTNTWDGLNRLTGTVFPDSTSVSNVYTRLDRTGVKDRLNNWSHYAYDGLQHLTNAVDPNNGVTAYSWCDCGSLSEIFDAQNGTSHPTYLNYDNQGNLYNVVFPDNSSVNYQFDLAGRMTNAFDGAGRAVQIGYNVQGLPTTLRCASGVLQSAIYDALNRPAIVTDANGVTVTNQFDAINELVRRTWPDAIGEGYGYSAAGLIAYTNRDGKATFYTRDGAGRLTGVTNANFEVTRMVYDSLDHVTDLWDGNTNHTQWRYNEYGWPTNKQDGLGRPAFRYLYNPNGWVTNRWTPEKGNTVYTYDNVGNLKTITYPQASISYAFDALNRLTNMVDAVGTTAFSYTPAGQLQSETGPWPCDTVAYTYAQGLLTNLNLTQPGGNWTQTYGYDVNWRLQTLTSPAGGFGYNYNFQPASALVTAISLPNGASITNGYDALARLRATALNNYWGHTLDGYLYTPDPLGLRTNIVRNLGLTTNSVAVGYDNIGQLTAWNAAETGGTSRQNEQIKYAYDPGHNLHTRTNGSLKLTFVTDGANQLTNVTRTGAYTLSGATPAPATSVTVNGQAAQIYGDFTFARTNLTLANGQNIFTNIAVNDYGLTVTNTLAVNLPQSVTLGFDNNGNLTNDGSRTFAYDSENQLTNVTVAGAFRKDFVFDGLNRLRIKREFSWTGSTWTPTNEVHYIYDGNMIIQHRNSNNVPTLTLTRGLDLSCTRQGAGGVGGLLAMTDSSGANYFYHQDAVGSVTALMDASENIVARREMDGFGRTSDLTGSKAGINPYWYLGQLYDENTRLTHFRGRDYSSDLMRWLCNDPSQERGGINQPSFVFNSPVNNIDTDGRQVVGAAGASTGTGVATTAGTATTGGAGMTTTVTAASTGAAEAGTIGTAGAAGLAGLSLAGGALIGNMIGIDRDAEHYPLGVNGPAMRPFPVPAPVPLPLPNPTPTPAAPKPKDCPPAKKQPKTYYHYSTKPNLAGLGLWSDSSATTVSGLDAKTASGGLGIPSPLYEYPVTIDPSQTPVQPQPPVAPNKYGPGGLPEVTFPNGTPPGSIGQPQVVPQPPIP